MDGLPGSKAIVEIERFGKKSLLAPHVPPASGEIQRPPEAVPARSREGLRGSNASERTRPPMLDGPSACHCDGCRPAAFATLAGALAARMARRCSWARAICQARGGP